MSQYNEFVDMLKKLYDLAKEIQDDASKPNDMQKFANFMARSQSITLEFNKKSILHAAKIVDNSPKDPIK